MTFSQALKEELVHLPIDKDLEKFALEGYIRSLGTINYSNFGIYLTLKTTNAHIARTIIRIVRETYQDVEVQILVQQTKKFNQKKNIYIINLTVGVKYLLKDLGLIETEEVKIFFRFKSMIKPKRTMRQYQQTIRAIFSGTGSINDPKKKSQYHLEFTLQNEHLLEDIQQLVNKFDINFKVSKREKNYALYLNKSEEISDFLKYIGSKKYLFEFESYRIQRDIMADQNRKANAEIANEVRKNIASNKQIEAIEQLQQKDKFKELSTKTQKIGFLRLENPEASLAELVEIEKGAISKSNMRHHLNLILKKAGEVENK